MSILLENEIILSANLETTSYLNASAKKKIQSDEFWKTSLCHIPSTFGASSKKIVPEKYDKNSYDILSKSSSWVCRDTDGVNHGRLQIASTFGKMVDIPGPGQYNPNDLKLSKREGAPKLTMGIRFSNDITHAKNNSVKIKRKKNAFPPLRKAPPPPKDSDLKNISVEGMRRSLLPGPGSYRTCDLDHIVKFERAPLARLVPRERLTRARTVIDLESLDIITSDDRVQLGARSDSRPSGQSVLDQLLSPSAAPAREGLQPLEELLQSPSSRAFGSRLNGFRYGGDYDIFKDPNKHSVAHSIGERRPLLGMKQVLPIGPGYYNDGKAFSFGERCPISSSAVDASSAVARKGRSR